MLIIPANIFSILITERAVNLRLFFVLGFSVFLPKFCILNNYPDCRFDHKDFSSLINMKEIAKAFGPAFMLSIFTSIFSSSANAGKNNQLYPRSIDLSGNIFHFSMPEDFSKDVPAADMVENLDIDDLKKFDDPEYGNLIRRWWDLKEPGFFGKKMGSVMVDISIQRVAQNREKLFHTDPYNIKERLDFILMLDDVYHQRYDELNKTMQADEGNYSAYNSGFATVSGQKIHSLHHDYVAHNVKWIKHFISAPAGATIVVFAIPVSEHTYLYANFTYSPNSNVAPREFGKFADQKFGAIYESFNIDYKPTNEIGQIVGGDWLKITNTELLNQHGPAILRLFYGDDSENALIKQEK